jgi:hypothetical protein
MANTLPLRPPEPADRTPAIEIVIDHDADPVDVAALDAAVAELLLASVAPAPAPPAGDAADADPSAAGRAAP